jgi:hypothetical protein
MMPFQRGSRSEEGTAMDEKEFLIDGPYQKNSNQEESE